MPQTNNGPLLNKNDKNDVICALLIPGRERQKHHYVELFGQQLHFRPNITTKSLVHSHCKLHINKTQLYIKGA